MTNTRIKLQGIYAQKLIDRMRPYRKIGTTQCVQIGADYEITVVTNSISGTVNGRAGDYICMNATGSLYPVPETSFLAMYEEAD